MIDFFHRNLLIFSHTNFSLTELWKLFLLDANWAPVHCPLDKICEHGRDGHAASDCDVHYLWKSVRVKRGASSPHCLPGNLPSPLPHLFKQSKRTKSLIFFFFFFQRVLAEQFEESEMGTLMRANTPVSRMMTTYTRRGPGQSYLKKALAHCFKKIIELGDLNLEINPLKVSLLRFWSHLSKEWPSSSSSLLGDRFMSNLLTILRLRLGKHAPCPAESLTMRRRPMTVWRKFLRLVCSRSGRSLTCSWMSSLAPWTWSHTASVGSQSRFASSRRYYFSFFLFPFPFLFLLFFS